MWITNKGIYLHTSRIKRWRGTDLSEGESQCVSEGHLDVCAKGAGNWWCLLEKVAIIMRVGLLYEYCLSLEV